jgi:hypothetical protein
MRITGSPHDSQSELSKPFAIGRKAMTSYHRTWLA